MRLEPAEINGCRICGEPELFPVMDLGDVPLSDFLVAESDSTVRVSPLNVVRCGNCSLVQLRHESLPADDLYNTYWYESATNESMVEALADVTEAAIQHLPSGVGPGDVVVDIGANDGTLLSTYPASTHRIAFEPSVLAAKASEHADVVINDVFSSDRSWQNGALAGRKVAIVTSIAMFYDLDRPLEFVEAVADILDHRGVWVVQMAYLPSMLDTNGFDNICHEHVTYYSLKTFMDVVERAGLEVSDVTFNEVNGGSIRAFVTHAGQHEISATVDKAVNDEEAMGLTTSYVYELFRERVSSVGSNVAEFVRSERANGRSFHVYGASTKGNTLLHYMNLDHRQLDYAAERSRSKVGLVMAGSGVPIISEEASRAMRPDYYFVLPWHFETSFLKRETAHLRQGGRFLFPLPEPRVITMTSGKILVRHL
jgi:hypothetical protein